MEQMQMFQKLMQNENFKLLMTHPKVQQALMDPDVQKIAKSKNMFQMMTHPKIAEALRDPEVMDLAAKISSSQPNK